VQAEDPVVDLPSRRHDDDRDVRGRADGAAQRHAVHVGQAEVEQHHVDAGEAVERAAAGGLPIHVETPSGQGWDQGLCDPVVVLDEQHAHFRYLPGNRCLPVTELRP
jgi:hypothetical protein